MYFFDNYDLDLNNIPVIPKDRNYWLVRADGGLYIQSKEFSYAICI